MKLTSKIAALFSAAVLLISVAVAPAGVNAAAGPKLTVTTADEWTALFDRTNQSNKTWLGADGIYTVALDGDDSFASADGDTKTFFIFSDTLMGSSNSSGKVVNGEGMPSQTSAVLTGSTPDPDNMRFVYGNGGNMQFGGQHLFGEHKWMLDCFVVGDAVYILGFPQQDWKPKQIDMIKIPIKNGEPQYSSYSKAPRISQLWHKTSDGTKLYAYGIGVTMNTVSAGAPDPDGYIYIYGYIDNTDNKSRKDLIVSRIKESDFPNFSKLTYWNGSGWGTDISKSAVLIKNVSCEMSVTPVTTGPYKGKYIAVYTHATQSHDIMYAIGDSPVGPFDDPVKFYNTPEHDRTSASGKGKLYTYNAKAHPHLSSGDKLLVSYNCNVADSGEQYSVDYHPRFLWLDLDPLDEGDGDVSETPDDTSSDTSSSTTSEKPNDTSSNTSSEKPNNTSSNTSSEKPGNTSSNASSEKPSNTSSNTSSEKPGNTSSNTTSEKPNNTSSNTTIEKPSNTSSSAASDGPSETPSDTASGEISSDVSGEASSETVSDVSSEMPSSDTDVSSEESGESSLPDASESTSSEETVDTDAPAGEENSDPRGIIIGVIAAVIVAIGVAVAVILIRKKK